MTTDDEPMSQNLAPGTSFWDIGKRTTAARTCPYRAGVWRL